MGVFGDFIRWLPTYFFPKICYGCGREGWFVCSDCLPKVAKTLNELICPNCQKPSPLGLTHPECQKKNGLDGLISFSRYAGWAKEIVKDAKFGLNPHWRAMKELAEEMAGELANRKSLIVNRKPPTIIIPIPLHWWRKMKRGFNQAEIIAKPIAKYLNLPLKTDLVERSTYSLPQTLVRDASRRANVRRAFSVNKNIKELPDSAILIDDVWTTGATMKECCRTLKLAGIKRVWGITLLRA
ncbi:ComF family protein [Candidatus Collierbacteria bacterium]|nr:ComF family protein [Candidatus Collierbacteria bacterium]